MLPHLELVRAAGLSPDRYVVNRGTPLPAETLDAPGLLERAVEVSLAFQLTPERLALSSLPGQVSLMMSRICAFLREAFYISRRDALTQRIVNKDDVLARLAARGFETLCLDGETVAQQAKIFSRAKIVVAPHGARA